MKTVGSHNIQAVNIQIPKYKILVFPLLEIEQYFDLIALDLTNIICTVSSVVLILGFNNKWAFGNHTVFEIPIDTQTFLFLTRYFCSLK